MHRDTTKIFKRWCNLFSLPALCLALMFSHSTLADNYNLIHTNASDVKLTASFSNQNTSKLRDGDIKTLWTNRNNTFPYYDYIEADLGQPASVAGIRISVETRQVEVEDNSADLAKLNRGKKQIKSIEQSLIGLKGDIQGIRDMLFEAQKIRDSSTFKSRINDLKGRLQTIRSKVNTLRNQVISLRKEMTGVSFLSAEYAKLLAIEVTLAGGLAEIDAGINKLSSCCSQIPGGYSWNGMPQQARDFLSENDHKVSNIQRQNYDAIFEVGRVKKDLNTIDFEPSALGSKVRFYIEYFDGDDWVRAVRKTINSQRKLITINFDQAITARKWRIRDFRNEQNNGKHVDIGEWHIMGQPIDSEAVNNLDDDNWSEMLAAPADECFFGAGSDQNIWPKGDQPCPAGSVTKKNEAYIWGMTHYSQKIADTTVVDRLYFGSGANVMCLAIETYLLIKTPYYRKNDLACEFQTNKRGWSDWRPPSLYVYDLMRDEVTQPELPETADLLRQFTTGFRSAGNHQGIIFIGGPNLDNSVNMFAFLGATGQIIGGTVLDYGYSSFRKMRVINNELYIGMGGAESSLESGGAVLRWKGRIEQILLGNTDTLFDFEIVGTGLSAEATEVNEFEGRIFASSWPNEDTPSGGALWRSPELPLSTENAETTLVWKNNSANSGAQQLKFTTAGDLILSDANNQIVWSSDTAKDNATKALMQDNGKLAIYDTDNNLLWSSDPKWNPEYPRINAIAHEKATAMAPGDTLEIGDKISSRTGHYHLVLQGNGELQIRGNELPWQRIWAGIEYDPDPLVASTYGVGPAREFGGWLYWGTMHVPSAALLKYEIELGKTLNDKTRGKILQGFHREGSIFRGRNLGTADEEIQLLYGGQALDDKMQPGYYPKRKSAYEFEAKKNKMGLTPLYGKGGFDNPWNNYIWSMVVYNDDLYIGTMDHSQIVLEDNLYTPHDVDSGSFVRNEYGADLFKIESPDIGAMPVTIDGMGNPTAYGIRTMASDGNSVFMGTANNANLNDQGGWQLMRFNADEIEPKAAGALPINGLYVGLLLLMLIRRHRALKPRTLNYQSAANKKPPQGGFLLSHQKLINNAAHSALKHCATI